MNTCPLCRVYTRVGALGLLAVGAGALIVGTAGHGRSALAESGETARPAVAAPEPPKDGGKPSDPKYVLGFTVKSIDGTDVDLAKYKGKVLLVVNVASKCGLTPQYEQLEALYKQKKDDGLVILGFPANNFGGQEPGTDAEIKTFCTSKYNVTFPMFAKISVKGADQHPLYKALCGQPAPIGGDPGWNFTKFVVDRQGRVQARFDSRVKPDDKALVAKIDELLKADATKPAEPPKAVN